MEARLFLISLWCGLYSRVLRSVFKKDTLSRKLWVSIFFNSLFWATVGVILGMLRTSYLTGDGFQMKYSIVFAGFGALYGGAMGYLEGPRKRTFNTVIWGLVGLYMGILKGGSVSGISSAISILVGGVVGVYGGRFFLKTPADRDQMLKDNLEWGDTGFSAILLASLFMFFVVFKIPSGSMRMTFVEGDHLFVNKFLYGVPIPLTEKKIFPFKKVSYADIVIFRFPAKDKTSTHYGKDFIKRVVGVGGDTIEIRNKVVYRNGQALDEPYKRHVDKKIYVPSYKVAPKEFQKFWVKGVATNIHGNNFRDNFGPVKIPEDHVMVMGDNRDRSYDSRFWGPLPLKAIKGKAWLLYWPIKRFSTVH